MQKQKVIVQHTSLTKLCKCDTIKVISSPSRFFCFEPWERELALVLALFLKFY